MNPAVCVQEIDTLLEFFSGNVGELAVLAAA